MTHPRISITIDVSAEPYGPAAVHVYESRNVVQMNLDKPSNVSRQQWKELAQWLDDHMGRALEDAKKQLTCLATAAREDTAEVTPMPVEAPF